MTKTQVEEALAKDGKCELTIRDGVSKQRLSELRKDVDGEALVRDRMMRFISHGLPAEDMTFSLKWSRRETSLEIEFTLVVNITL